LLSSNIAANLPSDFGGEFTTSPREILPPVGEVFWVAIDGGL